MSNNENESNQSEPNHSNSDRSESVELPGDTDETLQELMDIVNDVTTPNPIEGELIDPDRPQLLNSGVGLMGVMDNQTRPIPVERDPPRSFKSSPLFRKPTERFSIPPNAEDVDLDDLKTQVGVLDANQLKILEGELSKRREMLKEFQQHGWPTTSVNRRGPMVQENPVYGLRGDRLDQPKPRVDSRMGGAKPKINYKAPKGFDGSNRYKAEEFLAHCRHYFAVIRISDEDRHMVDVFGTLLEDTAFDWYLNYVEVADRMNFTLSWRDMQLAFMDAFAIPERSTHALNKVMVAQGKRELATFVVEFQNAIQKYNILCLEDSQRINDRDAVSRFFKCVHSRHIDALEASGYKLTDKNTLEEVIATMVQNESSRRHYLEIRGMSGGGSRSTEVEVGRCCSGLV